jgi:hypothetical protein
MLQCRHIIPAIESNANHYKEAKQLEEATRCAHQRRVAWVKRPCQQT